MDFLVSWEAEGYSWESFSGDEQNILRTLFEYGRTGENSRGWLALPSDDESFLAALSSLLLQELVQARELPYSAPVYALTSKGRALVFFYGEEGKETSRVKVARGSSR